MELRGDVFRPESTSLSPNLIPFFISLLPQNRKLFRIICPTFTRTHCDPQGRGDHATSLAYEVRTLIHRTFKYFLNLIPYTIYDVNSLNVQSLGVIYLVVWFSGVFYWNQVGMSYELRCREVEKELKRAPKWSNSPHPTMSIIRSRIKYVSRKSLGQERRGELCVSVPL